MEEIKRFVIVLTVVSVLVLFASYSMAFFAWAPFASWGRAGYISG